MKWIQGCFRGRSNRLQMTVKKKIILCPSGTNKWFWEVECFLGLPKFVLALKLPLGYVGGNSALMAHRTRADGESCCIFSRLCSPNGILSADFLFLSVQTPVRFSSQNNWVRLRPAAAAATAAALCFWRRADWLRKWGLTLRARWLAARSPLHSIHLSLSLSLSVCVGEVCRRSRRSACFNTTASNGQSHG